MLQNTPIDSEQRYIDQAGMDRSICSCMNIGTLLAELTDSQQIKEYMFEAEVESSGWKHVTKQPAAVVHLLNTKFFLQRGENMFRKVILAVCIAGTG